MELAEDLLSHSVRIALIKAVRLGRLEASSSPTTRHTIGCTVLTFVDKYIVLEGGIPFGLSIYQRLVGSGIKSRRHTEKLLNRYNSIFGDWPLPCVKNATKYKRNNVLGVNCEDGSVRACTSNLMDVHEDAIKSLPSFVKVVRLEVESCLREAI